MRCWVWAAFLASLCAVAPHVFADGLGELATCGQLGDRGENEAAIDHCTRAIQSGSLSNRDLVYAYTNRSIGYRNLRRFDDAIADCEKALALRADDPDAQMACGSGYGGKGDYAAGIQHFDRAILARSDDEIAHNNRGNLLDQTGDYAAALKDVDAAIAIKSDYLQAEFNRGVVLFNLGRFPDAVTALEKASKTAPDNAYVLLWLTLARRRGGVEMKSQAVMSAADDLDKHSWPWPVVEYYGGESMDLAKALSEADASSAQAVADAKCEGNFYFGEMAILDGRPDAAKPLLQQAADICPKTFIEHAGALAELARK